MQKVYLNGENLTIDDVVLVSKGLAEVAIDDKTRKKMAKCRKFVDSILKKDKAVYGINTGFGMLSDVRVEQKDLEALQINLIRSHAIGVGEPFKKEVVRAIILLRANVLAKGFSGISLETFDKLLELLNKDIVPFIPSQGSVGASGDLAPLAHLAIVLCGEGYVIDEKGNQVDTAKVFKKKGITPITLKAKEGLALINGTQVMTALGALAVHRVRNLLKLADIALTSTIEGIMGTDRAFDRKVNVVRPHAGQFAVSENVLKLIANSEIRASHINCPRVQDAYSVRCAPQVHGAVRDALTHVEKVITTELNSSTDNPLIFPRKRNRACELKHPTRLSCRDAGFSSRKKSMRTPSMMEKPTISSSGLRNCTIAVIIQRAIHEDVAIKRRLFILSRLVITVYMVAIIKMKAKRYVIVVAGPML